MKTRKLRVNLPVGISSFGGLVGSRIELQEDSQLVIQIAYSEKPTGLVRFHEERINPDFTVDFSSAQLNLHRVQGITGQNKTLAELEIVHGKEKQSRDPKK